MGNVGKLKFGKKNTLQKKSECFQSMKERNPMFFPSLWNIIAAVNRPVPKGVCMFQMGGDYLLHHFSIYQ